MRPMTGWNHWLRSLIFEWVQKVVETSCLILNSAATMFEGNFNSMLLSHDFNQLYPCLYIIWFILLNFEAFA